MRDEQKEDLMLLVLFLLGMMIGYLVGRVT